VVVCLESQVLGNYGGKVVRHEVEGDAQRFLGEVFDDARCTTPSRQPYPRRTCNKMGMRICLFILTLNTT